MKTIIFNTIEHDGVVLILKNPINAFLTFTNKEGGKQFWICEYRKGEGQEVRFVGWGGSEQEAVYSFQEDFICLYNQIACEKDHNLDFAGRELKNSIIEMIS